MQITTVGDCLHKIVRVGSFSLAGFIFTIVLAQPSQDEPPINPPREHQEFLRKAREGELVRPGTSQQQQLRLGEIREDFRRIQLVNTEKIRPALTSNTFDYRNIGKASSEIERRAVRLRRNLALPDSEEKSSEADNESATYLGQMKRLDTIIWSFVSNPIFRNTGVIDMQQAGKASRDLREIIKISEWLKRRHN